MESIKDINEKYCDACGRIIGYSEVYHTTECNKEICSECHELYLGDCEGE